MGKPKDNTNVDKIGEDELAVKITSDDGINGGLGNHAKGTVLRHLSTSAFNTLTCGGMAEALAPGTEVRDVEAVPGEPASE